MQTTAVLINLAAKAIGENQLGEAKQGIEAARALVAHCPEPVARQLRDPLAQLQLEFVRQSGGAKPAEAGQGQPEPGAQSSETDPSPAEAEERARARSKLWTPPGT